MRRKERFTSRRGWAMVAALALAFMPASLAACGPLAIGPSPTKTATPARCDPATQWRAPADNVALDDLAMVAPDEGWAVGAITAQREVSDSTPAGVIYHLTQGQWRRLPQTYPGAELSAISMDSPDDGWAASTSAIIGQGDRALVLHYTGGQWRQVDIPALDQVLKGPPGTSGSFIGSISVQMFGPDAGWMFAWTNIPSDPNNPASRPEVVILRYGHGAWTRIRAPNVSDTVGITSFSAVSGDEAWIVATDYGSPALTTLFARYVNGGWRIWPQTFPVAADRIAMVSPADGWTFASDSSGSTALLRFDGARWEPVATPTDWASGRIFLQSSVFPMPSDATWFPAIGRSRNALLMEYASGQWRQIAWPYTDVHPLRIIPGAPGELWGVSAIFHQEGCPPLFTTSIQQGVFLHYQQGRWSRQVLP